MLTITQEKLTDFIADRMLEAQWNSAVEGDFQAHVQQYRQLYDAAYQRLEGLKQFIELSNFSQEPEADILAFTQMLNDAQQKMTRMFEARQAGVQPA